MTREAFELYFRHLKPQGVLAIHVTNRLLDLPPVVEAEARSVGARAIDVTNAEDERERGLRVDVDAARSGRDAESNGERSGRVQN